MTASLWQDLTPSRRCDWIDQLRGWAVLVMIEVHCTNLWLELRLRPEWLNYINGLVAPSFLMAAGFSLVLSTFRPDGTLRPFHESGRRYAFILVCAGVLVLRHTRPHIHRPFRAPLIWFVSSAGIVCCFLLMYGLPWQTWERLAIWMAIGLLIYFVYGIRHSRLARAQARRGGD